MCLHMVDVCCVGVCVEWWLWKRAFVRDGERKKRQKVRSCLLCPPYVDFTPVLVSDWVTFRPVADP